MPRRHRRESFESRFGSLIDPEKDEELKGSKAEIEGKVQKILNLLEEEDNDGEESLATLIKDFHNHYRSLYESYDHLTKDLREKADKHGRDSSSSSSASSDSDDSPTKNGKNNGKVEHNIVSNTAGLERQLEIALLEVGELKGKLAVTVNEKEAQYLEYESALSKIQEAQGIIMNLRTEAERSNDEKLKLSTENAGLNIELESVRKLQAEQNQKFEAAIISVEEEKRNAEYLRITRSQLQFEVDTLKLELEEAERESLNLKEKLDLAENEVNELSQLQKTAEEENFKLSSKISQLEEEQLSSWYHEGKQWEEEKVKLENKISDLEMIVRERADEVIVTHNKMEELQNEVSVQIAALTEQVVSFQKQLKLLQSEKNQMEVQIERGKLESTEILAQAENQNTELVNKILDEEKKLKEQEDAFIKLCQVQKQLEAELRNCEEKLILSEKKIVEMTEQFQKDMETKNQEVHQLEERIEDLKTELEIKGEEISRLLENMRSTEFNQRMTARKLCITEQVLNETEESHMSKVVKLQEERKVLEERITTFSGIIATYKAAQKKMVTETSKKVNDTLNGIDTFSMKFEEDYGHLESRIYEIVNELKVMKNWSTESNAEKDQMKKEITSLLLQLIDERETVAQLRMKIDELETILQRNGDETKRLLHIVNEQEHNLKELRRKMNEKEDGFMSLSEEKREAIRQLCVWIDYHRNRYDELKDMISKTGGIRRQIAS